MLYEEDESLDDLLGPEVAADDDDDETHIAPQEGPQTEFLTTVADIAFYGGAAGGGKTFALIIEPLRHHDNPKFDAVIFRRNSTQVRNAGGLWDESTGVYGALGAHPREAVLDWTFPDGMRVKFGHLEHERSVYDWQGSQIPMIGFDEVTHFSFKQFFYMLSRNRSVSGVPAYVRATCNPDPDSWVRKFIDWWIGPDGFAIQERSGKIRWFVRKDDEIVWADTREELFKRFGRGVDVQPKSVTFISAKIEDNKILMDKDPGYLANLLALSKVDRARLKDGNWNIRATAGQIFSRDWFPVIDAIPAGYIQAIRYWDRAATKPNPENPDPDWSRGLKMLKYPDGRMLVCDIKGVRDTPGQVERLIKNTASHDGHSVRICGEQDPGSAGVAEAENFVRMLAGYNVMTVRNSKDKVTRAKPVSAAAENGDIFVLRAPWNDDFFTELENFPDGAHADQVDVLSGAFNQLCGGLSIADA